MISRRRIVAAVATALLAFTAAPAIAQDKSPVVGDEAPDFTLKDQADEDVTLSTYRGKKHVLLAFYPKDNSPGCTNQMKCYQRELKKLAAKGVEVLALSIDTTESHAGFAKSYGLRFKLLADTDLAVAKQYQVFVQTAGGGFAGRAVFLIDKEGKVQHVDRNYRVPRSLRGTPLLDAIKALGVTETAVEAALADLPPHEREGKTVLVALVRALIAEDIRGVDGLHHKLYGSRAGETPAMQQDRRKAEMQRYRTKFKNHDLTALKLADVAELADARVFTKELATPVAIGGMSTEGKALVGALGDDDLLVWARTKAPRLDNKEVVPRQLCLHLRKQDGAWKIYAKSRR